MRITTTIFFACLCVALVSSWPLPHEGLVRSQALDQLMVAEADNDAAALRNKRTIGLLRELFPDISKSVQDVNPEASDTNQVANEADTQSHAESQNSEVRVQFADESSNANDADNSQSESEALAPLDDIEAGEDDNRGKRFLNFGFGASAGNGGAASGGSGGGSGNFLFDIIRQAADSAARAAGTVYRVVAGTQSLGLGLSASRDIGPAAAPGAPMMMMPVPGGDINQMKPMMPPAAPPAAAPPAAAAAAPPAMMPAMPAAGMMMMKPANGTDGMMMMMPPLVAGSGSSGSSGTADPADDAPTPGPATEAVPGPVTRLFVIANRGISNLIQDLILRLAATSERIVNFKARLITSII